MKKFLRLTGVMFLVGLAAIMLGPRPDRNDEISFDPNNIGEDLDKYLLQNESDIPNLIDGAEKEIVWSDAGKGVKTEYAVIYIHGFSATKYEIRPVPDKVANGLGANLYFTRLVGHGRDGAGLAQANMNDWVQDMAEAIAIARRLGEKTIIVTTSTGGTLASWAASKPELMKDVAGIVLVSPNYGIAAVPTFVLNMPWSETLLPMLVGHQREWEPQNEMHGKWTTNSYPSIAVFPMAALIKTANIVDYSKVEVPAMFIYSQKDEIVQPKITDEVVNQWAGPKKVINLDSGQDPRNHLITGDILSPSTTKQVSEEILEWINGLSS